MIPLPSETKLLILQLFLLSYPGVGTVQSQVSVRHVAIKHANITNIEPVSRTINQGSIASLVPISFIHLGRLNEDAVQIVRFACSTY